MIQIQKYGIFKEADQLVRLQVYVTQNAWVCVLLLAPGEPGFTVDSIGVESLKIRETGIGLLDGDIASEDAKGIFHQEVGGNEITHSVDVGNIVRCQKVIKIKLNNLGGVAVTDEDAEFRRISAIHPGIDIVVDGGDGILERTPLQQSVRERFSALELFRGMALKYHLLGTAKPVLGKAGADEHQGHDCRDGRDCRDDNLDFVGHNVTPRL